MKQIQLTARLRIHPGKLHAFKVAAAACLRCVREKDTGTTQYDWFFSADEAECVVRETYADSEAVLGHTENVGEALGELLSTCDISLELYGEPSSALLKAVEGLPCQLYSHFQGL